MEIVPNLEAGGKDLEYHLRTGMGILNTMQKAMHGHYEKGYQRP